MSNSHEWQFDNAWQEMLNHATLKVSLHFCHVSPNVTAFRGRNTHFGREQSLHECACEISLRKRRYRYAADMTRFDALRRL